MIRQTFSFAFLLSLTCAGFICPVLRAQQTTGSILGTVDDAQGAVVVGAQVTAQNSETGLSRSVQTSNGGEYRIDFLPPGSYELQVTNAGFRTFRQTGITLQVGQAARVDAHLQLGEATSTVTVEGGVPAVNTTDATVGQTTTTEQITTLPLVNRNPIPC